jgi:N,N-dimethylformamidase
MDILGYSNKLSAEPGESIDFMVSTDRATFDAALVRLVCGDDKPHGPGFKEIPMAASIAGRYTGRVQELRPGSFLLVPATDRLDLAAGFTLLARVFPTTPALGRAQGLIARWDPTRVHGYSLGLDDQGRLCLSIGDGQLRKETVTAEHALQSHAWYIVFGAYDPASGRLRVGYQRRETWGDPADQGAWEKSTAVTMAPRASDPLLVAAEHLDESASMPAAVGAFNGKIDGPLILDRPLADDDIRRIGRDPQVAPPTDSVVGCWDFSRDISTVQVRDLSRNRLHGTLFNMPMRACTGFSWTGTTTDWRDEPATYGAIHFHEDDLEDAGWDVDFQFSVPEGMPSGVYAAKVTTDSGEDYLPFVVRRPVGKPTAPVLLLLPTFSYLAYANEHKAWLNPERAAILGVPDIAKYVQSQDLYMRDHELLSLYEKHSDGSGVAYSSRLRPLLTIRPKYDKPLFRAPHNFNADLYIVDWLEHEGYRHDVATDDDLDHYGTDLLAPYKVVITGSHPEYWSAQMLDGLSGYLGEGGRLMYLGGNGFYWVTSVHSSRPHVIESRRGHSGTRAWASEPGECHHSTTGEPGGLWRNRGRAPQRIAGVGTTSLGCDRSLPYRRQADSFLEEARFIFEGVDSDAVIGDHGRLLDGAAGLETDRLDYALGTPPHARLLATATGFSEHYLGSIEDALESDAVKAGPANPDIRADMVYFTGPKGGAVFSVGSMAWTAALFVNGYNNAVSTITGNVLRAFQT